MDKADYHMAHCNCHFDYTHEKIMFCPLHINAFELLAALKRFVHPDNKWDGIWHTPQVNRAPVLSCRHCNGYSTDSEAHDIDKFRHDETCAIIEARAAIAAATERQPA